MKIAKQVLPATASVFLLATTLLLPITLAQGAPTPSPCATAVCATKGAPSPIIGAGTSSLLAIGYGVYWLVRRRGSKQDA
jgi:hypothetical protein